MEESREARRLHRFGVGASFALESSEARRCVFFSGTFTFSVEACDEVDPSQGAASTTKGLSLLVEFGDSLVMVKANNLANQGAV